MEFSTDSQIPLFFSQLLREPESEGTIERILFRSSQTKKLLGLPVLMEALGVHLEPEFNEEVRPQATVFLFFGEERIGFGFVGQVAEEEDLIATMKYWESYLVEDFQPLINMLAPEATEFTDRVKIGLVDNQRYKYIESSQAGVEVCYFIFGGYFVFTTSREAMVAVIEKLVE